MAVALVIALPGLALGQETTPAATGDPQQAENARGPLPPPVPATARVTLRVKGIGGRTVGVGNGINAIAKLKPFIDGEELLFRFTRNGNVKKEKSVPVHEIGDTGVGKANLRWRNLVKPGRHRIRVIHQATPAQEEDKARSPRFTIRYPNLDPGQNNSNVRLFKRLLDRQGYYINGGSGYDAATQRAVMAFNKVNRERRTYNATSSDFRTVAAGNGTFRLARPGAGRHVEVDISRQVMALAAEGEAKAIFHVSTGAPATPSDRGTFKFYRRQPGYNGVGMYYSVYYHGGEAIHGYKSVPPYNASHGCIRNPIPNSKWIYDWVSLGMTIFVYD